MPASASASASSASSASAEICWVTLTMRRSSSASSVVPFGRMRSLAWIWVPTGAPSTETSMNSGMWVASASTEIDVVLGDDQGVGGGVADDVDRDVDGDLLAAA